MCSMVLCGGFAVVLGIVRILAPFPGVAVHIEQAPCVRFLLTHRMRLISGVPIVPSVAVQLGLAVTEIIARRAPRAASVLPLGLGRQAVFLSFFAIKPLAEGRGVVPVHTYHRVVVGL